MVVWRTWPLKRYWGGLTLFSLPLIAHAVCTGMHSHWQSTKLPNSCSGKHVCTWVVCAEALISVWKVCNSKRYCETRFTNTITNEIFLSSENALNFTHTVAVFVLLCTLLHVYALCDCCTGEGGALPYMCIIGYVPFLRPPFSALNFRSRAYHFHKLKRKKSAPEQHHFRIFSAPETIIFKMSLPSSRSRPVYCGQPSVPGLQPARVPVRRVLKSAPETPNFTLEPAPEPRIFTLELAPEPPIFHFAVAPTYQKCGPSAPPPPPPGCCSFECCVMYM